MNRLERLFKRKPNGILSVYFTAGYPHPDDTVSVIRELEAQGTDLIEIGIPFSDPMADGPVIQQSSTVSLNGGMSLGRLFEQLEGIRTKAELPLILMGYLNPVMQYGVEAFCRKCAETGIDGVIIPDLPFHDYLAEYKPLGEKYGLNFIMLITPETSEERIRFIDEHTDGFIYMVSTASTTGAQDRFGPETLAYFDRIDALGLRNPRLIGFGISNKETFDAALAHADGAIIGSKFVKLLGESPSPAVAVSRLMRVLGRS